MNLIFNLLNYMWLVKNDFNLKSYMRQWVSISFFERFFWNEICDICLLMKFYEIYFLSSSVCVRRETDEGVKVSLLVMNKQYMAHIFYLSTYPLLKNNKSSFLAILILKKKKNESFQTTTLNWIMHNAFCILWSVCTRHASHFEKWMH